VRHCDGTIMADGLDFRLEPCSEVPMRRIGLAVVWGGTRWSKRPRGDITAGADSRCALG